jgi:hypothetical protein
MPDLIIMAVLAFLPAFLLFCFADGDKKSATLVGAIIIVLSLWIASAYIFDVPTITHTKIIAFKDDNGNERQIVYYHGDAINIQDEMKCILNPETQEVQIVDKENTWSCGLFLCLRIRNFTAIPIPFVETKVDL